MRYFNIFNDLTWINTMVHFLMFRLHMFRYGCVSSVPGVCFQTMAHFWCFDDPFLVFPAPISWCCPFTWFDNGAFPLYRDFPVQTRTHFWSVDDPFLLLPAPICWCVHCQGFDTGAFPLYLEFPSKPGLISDVISDFPRNSFAITFSSFLMRQPCFWTTLWCFSFI